MKRNIIVSLVIILFAHTVYGSSRSIEAMIKTFYTNKRVIVTGGCGFIGSYLVEKLVELNAHVIIIDNLSTGSEENIKDVRNQVTLHTRDIRNDCSDIVTNADIVFHLAASISVAESVENPSNCHAINVGGTLNILEYMRINHIPAFVFSSSAAVYGNHDGICDESLTCNPTSMYGLSKQNGEQLAKLYSDRYNLSTICLRYFNVYGKRQNPHGQYAGVRAKFNHCMAHNEPITILGDGQQVRDFVSVEQIVEANLIAGIIASQQTQFHTVCNVATGKSITLLQLIDELKKEYPFYSQEISFAPERVGDIRISQADCQRYQKLTEFIQ